MENSIDLVAIVLLLGATQGLFLTLLLITKPINKTANRLLALLIFTYSAFIVESSISGTQVAERFPHMLGLFAGVVYLNGPLHYLYALALIKADFSFSKKHLYHFLPILIFYAYFLFPFYLKSGTFKIAFFQSIEQNGPPASLLFFSWVVLFQGVIYMIFTFMLLKQHSRTIKDSFSTIENINLEWLKNITVLTMVIWIIGIIIEFLQIFDFNHPIQGTVPISIAILIYVMGYLGLRQPEIFSGPSAARNPHIQSPVIPELGSAQSDKDESEIQESPDRDERKYERSGLTKDRAQFLHKKLIGLMETKKPFTDSNLKLNQLAKMVSTSPNYLSQVINEEGQQNFYDFVNGYRIEEAKKMIVDPAHEKMTILSIAYEVGFNSKSAFNTSFKKYTGMTPTQFKKSQQ